MPQRTANIAGSRASVIDLAAAASKRQAGGAATPSAASVETRSDSPSSAMKASVSGAMFGRSTMVARRPGPSDSRRSRHRRSRRPISSPMWTVRLGERWRLYRLGGAEIHRSVRKKSLYTGDTSDTNFYLLNQVTQPIVHVLDEWAKVALDSTGRARRRSDWLRKTDRICLYFPAFLLVSGVCDRWDFCMGRFCPGGLIRRSNGDLGGANLCPHSLSSLRRLGLGRASQTT